MFLPYAVMLSKNAADGIRRYVEGGGTAVAEARLGWNDERGFANDIIPGFGLNEVFGAREKLIRPVDKPVITLEASSELPGILPGQQAAGAAFEEDLEAAPGARVLGRFADGEPAIVQNSFGKGAAVIIGSFVGLACEREPEGSTRQLLLSLAKAAKMSPEVEVTGSRPGEIEVRRLVGSRGNLLFIHNHSDTPNDASISIHLPWSVGKATNLENGQSVPVRQSDGAISFQQTLVGEQILVLLLEP